MSSIYETPDLTILAAQYKEIYDSHAPDPTVRMARRYGVSRATMGRWLQTARQKGALETYQRHRQSPDICPHCGWRCRNAHLRDGEA